MTDLRRMPIYNPTTGEIERTGPYVDEILGRLSLEFLEEMAVASTYFPSLAARAHIKTVTGTSYTFLASDHGKILDFTSGSAVTATLPTGLPVEWCCSISQGGAGQVTIAAAPGVSRNEPDSLYSTEKQFVLVTLIAFGADSFRIYGRTA